MSGKLLNVNNIAAAGMVVATTATTIPMISRHDETPGEMDARQVINRLPVSARAGRPFRFPAAANMNAGRSSRDDCRQADRRRDGDWRGDDAGAERRRRP